MRPKDHPGSVRTYKKIRKLCQKLDNACLPSIEGTLSSDQLTELYQRLKDSRFKHILLPDITAKGRIRTLQNEATWLRTINEFENPKREQKKNNLPPSIPQDRTIAETTNDSRDDINETTDASRVDVNSCQRQRSALYEPVEIYVG